MDRKVTIETVIKPDEGETLIRMMGEAVASVTDALKKLFPLAWAAREKAETVSMASDPNER